MQYFNICGLRVVFLGYIGGYMHHTPPQKPNHEIWAAFPKIFFIFLFFFFPIFFRVKGQKNGCFLDVGVVIGWVNAKFGYFLSIFRRFRVLDEGLYVLHWESV